jgi:putative alpha-1,2-mannosidase
LFDHVTIHLSEAHHGGETFVIEALDNGPGNIFVGEASLDGRSLSAPVLSHEAITEGGALRLQMTATPN